MKLARFIFCLNFFVMICFTTNAYAENVVLNFSYGIDNVAKNGKELPIEITLENKDNQEFSGTISVNTFESNNSVYVYNIDVVIPGKSSITKNENISVTNKTNTIVIDVYNNKEEVVTSTRTSIDLSYYDDMMIVGAITSDFNSLSYIDNLPFYNNILSVKLVEITEEAYKKNNNIFSCIDLLLISDVDISSYSEEFRRAIEQHMLNSNFLLAPYNGEISDSNIHIDFKKDYYADVIYNESGIAIYASFNINELSNDKDGKNIIASLIEKSFGKNRLDRLADKEKILSFNDYYHISNLLNIIDKLKLPDIFILTLALVFYILFITVLLYVFLRNINMRHLYGRLALCTSIIFTILMVGFGYSTMKRDTFLTYISIVDINGPNTKEKAFLNFRTSESSSYSFNTSANNKLYPILRNTKEPIVSLDFMDLKSIKVTEFSKRGDRTYVLVDNAKDFDANIFTYENSSYLNDVYNVSCSVSKFDGEVSGRITNNMNIDIKNASILFYGKIQKIGDIEANRSVSLSRTTSIGAPIGNNAMLSEMLGGDSNNENIIKYYLDENVYGYYDYGLLFGFIDNNGTLDLNSNDVGEVYGKTLIVNKIILDDIIEFKDKCAMERDVNNIYGYYNNVNNSTNGETEVINEYNFGMQYNISKIYLEELYNYDHGKIDSNVPFYGEIYAYNINTGTYDVIHNNSISYHELQKYLTSNNSIIFKYIPLSKDPLYREVSLPVVRAICSLKS